MMQYRKLHSSESAGEQITPKEVLSPNEAPRLT